MTGKFITFEGGEGSGKSTQCKLLAERLTNSGNEVLLTREPGGTDFAETIRELILSGRVKKFGAFAEAVLFSLARDEHLEKKIRPALADGKWVISDRFMDSTRAYQGAAGGVDQETLKGFERVVVEDTRPYLTFILDLPAEIGLQRAAKRGAELGETTDRFESMDLAFHQKLRDAFLEIAEEDPRRCVVIDAQQDPHEINDIVWKNILETFAEKAG